MPNAKAPKGGNATPNKQASQQTADSKTAVDNAGHNAHPDRSVNNPHPAERATPK